MTKLSSFSFLPLNFFLPPNDKLYLFSALPALEWTLAIKVVHFPISVEEPMPTVMPRTMKIYCSEERHDHERRYVCSVHTTLHEKKTQSVWPRDMNEEYYREKKVHWHRTPSLSTYYFILSWIACKPYMHCWLCWKIHEIIWKFISIFFFFVSVRRTNFSLLL